MKKVPPTELPEHSSVEAKESNNETVAKNSSTDEIAQGIVNQYFMTTPSADDLNVGAEYAKQFNLFDAQSYLDNYYPPVNYEHVTYISQAIDLVVDRQSTKDATTVSVIDLNILSAELSSISREPVSSELLENYCIYDFMVRQAIPRLLQDFPDDHLRILDIGGGPTIYQHIPLIGISESITHAEYLPANRAAVEAWQQRTSDFNWNSYFKYCQALIVQHSDSFRIATDEVQQRLNALSHGTPELLEDALRERIKKIIPVNVFESDLGLPETEPPDVVTVSRTGNVELLTSNFCIESATANYEQWQNGMKNIADKVPPEKFLLMTAIRQATAYQVGNHQMPAVALSAQDIHSELKRLRFEVLQITELVGSDQAHTGYNGMIFVLAKKLADNT